ncbi:hypothetical protein K3152_08640 [Qipengyuania sp. 1NDH17]|uniref:Uncharacterized protein n=1 Tax=Qipengyuania polymorpha TaxID=2867234 RepID=A0ABS7J166_9SPHN|nr:hypothetical protein [Qipengyuania polymorpha]MBX7458310.1 hypothetical protein [Qipengyuania polymorpha]
MTDDAPAKAGMGSGKMALWGVGIFFGLAFLGALMEGPEDDASANTLASMEADAMLEAEADAIEASANEAAAAVSEPEPRSDWSVSEQKDELRGTTDRFAEVTSNNSVRFDFPYCCDSRLRMTVRKTQQYGEDVIFQISDGQIVCRIRDCAGMISIDGKPERLSLNRSADGDSTVVFAQYPAAIIRKLKSSEKVIVELPFYREGNRQFKFDTAGLEWE